MKNLKKIGFLSIIVLLSLQCGIRKSEPTKSYARITEEGFINCYEPGLLTLKGEPLWCETSAVLYESGKLFLGNDHQMPDERSAVFSVDFEEGSGFGEPTYSMHPLLKLGSKYEEFAISPDGKTVFLITGFDRVKEDGSSEWDGYNGFYYWPAGEMDKVKVISKNTQDSTSISIRPEFSKVLADDIFPDVMPYFKIEGMAVLNDQFLLGIREYGKNYSDFRYSAKIISVSYEHKDDMVFIKEDYKVLSDINANSLEPSIKEPLALSSIEYNKYDDNFYLLTSFEDEKGNIGAYLWTASLTELENNMMNPVLDEREIPLKFNHKAEDMTFIGKNKLLVIHDDDKKITRIGEVERLPHQAAYSIVVLN